MGTTVVLKFIWSPLLIVQLEEGVMNRYEMRRKLFSSLYHSIATTIEEYSDFFVEMLPRFLNEMDKTFSCPKVRMGR